MQRDSIIIFIHQICFPLFGGKEGYFWKYIPNSNARGERIVFCDDRIPIQILFDFPKMTEYQYEYYIYGLEQLTE